MSIQRAASDASLQGWAETTRADADATADGEHDDDELRRLLDAEFGMEESAGGGDNDPEVVAAAGGKEGKRGGSARPPTNPAKRRRRPRRAEASANDADESQQHGKALPPIRPDAELPVLRPASRTSAFDACVATIERERQEYEAELKRKSSNMNEALRRDIAPPTISTITFLAPFEPPVPSNALEDELWRTATASDAWRAFNQEAYAIGAAPRMGAKFCGQTLAMAHGVGGTNRVSIKFVKKHLHVTGCLTVTDALKAIEYGLRVLEFMEAWASTSRSASDAFDFLSSARGGGDTSRPRACTGLWTPLINTNCVLHATLHLANTRDVLEHGCSGSSGTMTSRTDFQKHPALLAAYTPPDTWRGAVLSTMNNKRANIKLFKKGSVIVSAPSFRMLCGTYKLLFNLIILNLEKVISEEAADHDRRVDESMVLDMYRALMQSSVAQ